jgi:hypothetical protein
MAASLPVPPANLSRGVLDAIGHGIAVLDADGRVIDVNRTAEAMLGRPRDSALGEALAAIGVPVGPRQGRSQCTATRADGTAFVADVTVVRVPGASPRFAAHIHDVSVVRDAEARRDRRAARRSAVSDLRRRARSDRDVEGLVGRALDVVSGLLDADRVAAVPLWAVADGPAAAARAEDVAVVHDGALPRAWRADGVRCAAVAAIGGAPPRYLTAQQRTARGFDGDELDFLGAVAQVLRGALDDDAWPGGSAA